MKMNFKNKILIIEDDFIVRTSLVMLLETYDYDISESDSGESALEYLTENKMHLIITDMRLPGISGENFILTANEIDKNFKFIIYTGSHEYTLSQALTDIGITEQNIIHKPIQDINHFKKTIDNLLAS